MGPPKRRRLDAVGELCARVLEVRCSLASAPAAAGSVVKRLADPQLTAGLPRHQRKLLGAAVAAARAAAGSTQAEAAARAAHTLDELFHAVCVESPQSAPPPCDYHEAVGAALERGGAARAMRRLLDLHPESERELQELWGLDVAALAEGRVLWTSAEQNPLLRSLRWRLVETVMLFVVHAQPPSRERHKLWRSWCDAQSALQMLYAFAAPTPQAIEKLAGLSPLVEVGAGRGYWALALRNAGASVHATDSRPPGAPGAAGDNEYHARLPPFADVAAREAPVAAALAGKATLFLCYPPPGERCAADALGSYRGNCVALVGEMVGETGSVEFERALLADWRLVDAVPLPHWPDTAASLTVWRRRTDKQPLRSCCVLVDHPDDAFSPLSCSTCGAQDGLRRCLTSAAVQYCSAECAEAGRAGHEAALAVRGLPAAVRWPDSFELLSQSRRRHRCLQDNAKAAA